MFLEIVELVEAGNCCEGLDRFLSAVSWVGGVHVAGQQWETLLGGGYLVGEEGGHQVEELAQQYAGPH